MDCSIVSETNFFWGLWHGVMAVFSLVADIFWEVDVYDRCQQSWWYDLGFLLGFGFLGVVGFHLDTGILFIALIVMFIAWAIWMLSGVILIGGGILIVGLILYILYRRYHLSTSGRHT